MRMSSAEITIDLRGSGRPGEPHPVTQHTTAVDGVSHADCTGSPDRGGNYFFQAEVGMDLETTQVAARHFVKLAMFWQQRGAQIGETTLFKQISGGTQKQQ